MHKLKNICIISSGQTFRSKIEHDPAGDVVVIQMKDMNENYTGINGELTLVSENVISEKQLLKHGDVLFLARGNNNKAFVFDLEVKAVAVSSFFVLRPKTNKVDPFYISWFLNQPKTQNFLLSTQEGATVASIKKQTLDEMEIALPDLNEQNKIAGVYQLHLKEMELMSQLKTKRNELINTLLISKIE